MFYGREGVDISHRLPCDEKQNEVQMHPTLRAHVGARQVLCNSSTNRYRTASGDLWWL
jgi:hypothetical protein